MTNPRRHDGFITAFAVLSWSLLAACPAIVAAQAGPELVHSGLECIPTTQFSVLSAAIRPAEEIQTARVYFRSDKYPDFYYVDMALDDGEFRAVLPKPTAETSRVYYYIEAVDIGFSSTRTVEYDPDVVEDEDECKRRDPGAAYFAGQSPGIVVGALRAGASSIPPGFLAEGIVGFVSLTGAGGGASATTLIAIGGAAAGAAGAGVLASGGGGSATTTSARPVSPAESPPATTTTTTPAAGPGASPVKACFTTEPDPPEIEVGQRIKLDGRCSEPAGSLVYSWELGDGRTRDGAFIEPTYPRAGTYTVVLTVRRAAGLKAAGQNEEEVDRTMKQIIVREPPPVGADLSISKTSSPNPFVPFQQNLTYSITVKNLGPGEATGVTVVDNLPSTMVVLDNGGCTPTGQPQLTCDLGTLSPGTEHGITMVLAASRLNPPGATIVNRAEVRANEPDPDLGNNTATATTQVPAMKRESPARAKELSLTTQLVVSRDKALVFGNLTLNGTGVITVPAGTPQRHRLQAKPGRNVVEAYAVHGLDRVGYWHFDFTASEGFVKGSLRVDSGDVVALLSDSVVFRVTPASRIRFTFELSP